MQAVLDLFRTPASERYAFNPAQGSAGYGNQGTTDHDLNHHNFVEEVVAVEKFQHAEFDLSTATLGQLLTRIIPDADVHSPNVVVVGAQSSGKTKMIISMVFHHLIENSSVTDAMGEKLLRLFQTGEEMVTRRPTKIQFVKTLPDSPCTISLQLGTESANFDDPKFEEIVNQVHQECASRDGKSFRGELRVTIAAAGLPNISFTDLPGLTTFERALADCQEGGSKNLHDLVKQYMNDRKSTIVVVEPASLDDFSTSQISPLLKGMQEAGRVDIFDTAVLVLSKCDTVKHGDKIMRIIEKTSTKMADFPYKHVVGVVNKIDNGDEAPDYTLSYAEFKQQFQATKVREKETFSTFLNKDGTPCSTKEQCTTAAVFHQMDKITFGLVHRSIEKGLESIQEKVGDVEQKIRDELAPPPGLYAATDCAVNSQFSRRAILKLAQHKLPALVEASFDSARLHVYEYDQRGLQREYLYLTSIGVDWPVAPAPGSMTASRKRREAIDLLRLRFGRFVDKKVAEAIAQVLTDPDHGCFAALHSPFHRIDRFPLLVSSLRQGFQAMLPECLQKGKAAIAAHLGHFWQFEVPKGESLCGMVDQLKHVALRAVFEALCERILDKQFDALLQDDVLFVEQAEFAGHRHRLHHRWEHLRQQAAILEHCSVVTNNDDLRATLQQASEEQQALTQTSWLNFWRRAELLSRDQQVDDLAQVDDEMNVDDDSSNVEESDLDSVMDDASDGEGEPTLSDRDLRADMKPSKRAKTSHQPAEPDSRGVWAAVQLGGTSAQLGSDSPTQASVGSSTSFRARSTGIRDQYDYPANRTTIDQANSSRPPPPSPAAPSPTHAVLHSYAAVLNTTPNTSSDAKSSSSRVASSRDVESSGEAKGSDVVDLTADY